MSMCACMYHDCSKVGRCLAKEPRGIILVTDEPLKLPEMSEEKREYYIRAIINAKAMLMFDEQIRLFVEETKKCGNEKSNPL